MASMAVSHVWMTMVRPHDYVAFRTKREGCHIVVMVPEMEVADEPDILDTYPNYPVLPVILLERSFKREKWTANYAEVARCEALQLWQDRNDGRTDIMPHLLYSGDCPFWGGVKREGIVVACSGVEPWFDRMIAGIIAEMLIAGSYHAWMKSEDKKEDLDKLS